MTSGSIYEPGIIRTFRLFTGVRLAMAAFSVLVNLLATGWQPSLSPLLLAWLLLDAALLLGYLWLPRLEHWLKGYYLPLGLIWATVGPLVAEHLIFFQLLNATSPRASFMLVLQPILVLFIPLVIFSWRYSMREVLIFSGATFLFDNLLVFITYSNSALANMDTYSPIIGMSFLRTVLFLMVGYMVASLVRVQREQNRQLAEANEQLARYAATLEQLTISRERNRMARELHDVLAHTMSGVAVELEGVRAMLPVDPQRAEALLGHSLQAVREGLSETRRALQALRASPLEDLGLALAVQYLAESIAGRAGLQTDLQMETDLPDLPIEVQQTFYRVAQEALTNVVTHAQASRVQVCLRRDGPALKLAIQDNGVGFDEHDVDSSQKYGLLGIRERVEMIRGQLSITSQPGAGTQLQLVYAGPSEGLND